MLVCFGFIGVKGSGVDEREGMKWPTPPPYRRRRPRIVPPPPAAKNTEESALSFTHNAPPTLPPKQTNPLTAYIHRSA
jgi:hypothetical protein